MSWACKRIGVLLVALLGCGGSGSFPTTDAAVDLLPCNTLTALAAQPVLGPWKTRRAYYSPDRSFLLLQVRGTPDSLIRVDLPSGDSSTVVDALGAVQPLGSSGAFLIYGTGDGGDETRVYDGKKVRKLFTGGCDFQSTPDGTRLYVDGSCVGAEDGLEVIDVATGTSTLVDKHAVMGPVAMTPKGQWIAYQTGDSYYVHDRTIVVADAAGSSYTVASAEDIASLVFVADDLLVFQAASTSGSPGDLRGHLPGSGDTSFLIASGYDDYQFSPDRTRALAAKWPAPSDTSGSESIYSVPLHGGDPLLLVADWSFPYSVQPFAFDSQSKYVVYVSLTGYAGSLNLPTYEVSVIDLHGSKPRKLSNGAGFGITPATSSVLLNDTDADGHCRLRLTDLATGRDIFSYSSTGEIGSATALRGDQAVLFAELDGDTRRSRFMSVSFPQSVALGEWNDPDYRGASPMPVEADPSECFTVVNTETPSPGTRLVLLPE